jgi:hypothetical protein
MRRDYAHIESRMHQFMQHREVERAALWNASAVHRSR